MEYTFLKTFSLHYVFKRFYRNLLLTLGNLKKMYICMFQKQQFALSTSLNYTDVTAVHLEIYSTACPSVKTT